MVRKLEISEEYLIDCLKFASIKTVGEVLSNVEIVTNQEQLKQVIKNTIYQSFRDLKAQIMAFDSGIKFIQPTPKTVT